MADWGWEIEQLDEMWGIKNDLLKFFLEGKTLKEAMEIMIERSHNEYFYALSWLQITESGMIHPKLKDITLKLINKEMESDYPFFDDPIVYKELKEHIESTKEMEI